MPLLLFFQVLSISSLSEIDLVLDFTFAQRQVAAGCVFVFTQLLSAVPGLLSAGASPCAGDSRLLVPRRPDPSCLRCALLLLLLLLMPASRYSAAQAATLPPAHADTQCATTLHSFAGLLLLTHFLAHAAALCCPTLFCPAKTTCSVLSKY